MNCLLDDYLILYINTKEKRFLQSAISVLANCGCDSKTIEYIITWESDIIKFRKIRTLIINKDFWLDDLKRYKEGSKKSFFVGDINNYLAMRFDNKRCITNKTLTLSELVMMFDEAWKISRLYKDRVPPVVYNECYELSKYENNKSLLIFQFRIRIEESYRKSNNLPDIDDFYAKKIIDKLYDYEFNILKDKNIKLI